MLGEVEMVGRERWEDAMTITVRGDVAPGTAAQQTAVAVAPQAVVLRPLPQNITGASCKNR